MSLRYNVKQVFSPYNMLYTDGIIECLSSGIDIALPILDDLNLKDGKTFYFKATNNFRLITLDATTFKINGLNTYSVLDGTVFSAKYYLNQWYLDVYDVASGGSGTVTNVATAGLISGGPITTAGTITSSMNSGRLVGRSTAGIGIFEEITIGSGLSLIDGTLSAVGSTTFLDSLFRIVDNVDNSKQIAWEASGISTATTRTITMVNFSGTQVLSAGALTSTRIPFSTTSGLTDNANLVWDNVNNQLELANAGSVTQPTLMFGTAVGLYVPTTATLGFAISSVLRMQCDATDLRSGITGGFRALHSSGSATNAVFCANNDLDNGIYFSAANVFDITVGGTNRMSINTTNITGPASSYLIRHTAGSATTPTYSFPASTGAGFYSDATNTIKWSTAGVQRGTIDSAGRVFLGGATAPTAVLHLAAGTATASTGPLKYTSGTLLTVAEAGVQEYLTNLKYFTPATAVRNVDLIAQQQVNFAAFVKTADTTFADITNLSTTVTNGAQYIIEGYLFCTTIDATGGAKFQFSGTGTITSNIQVEFVDNTADVLTIAENITGTGVSVNTVGPTVGCFKFYGHVRCTGTGSLTIQFAQQVANGSSSVAGGSWVRLSQAA